VISVISVISGGISLSSTCCGTAVPIIISNGACCSLGGLPGNHVLDLLMLLGAQLERL
jgi:uncharacterized protein YcsI (UPF0317 family)